MDRYYDYFDGMKIANMPDKSKSSSLLTAEENEVIFSLLGQRCQTLATTVVELYSTGGRDSDRWYFKDIGVLCLVKDNGKRSYFFRLFCLTKRKMIWEHEVYNNINYEAATPYLHTFEAEDCIVGFSFADEEEGRQLRSALLAKLEMKKQKREKRNRTHSANNLMVQHVPPSYVVKTPLTKSPLTKPKMPDRKKDGKKLTKADIGTPHDFKHVSHVGWNANTGFEIDIQDPQMKQFFAMAGVSESQLKDEETMQFIYDFIEKNGGMDAVKGEVAPAPPIPSRARAPPPPPSRTPPTVPPPPPPPPPPIRTVPPRPSSPTNDRTSDFKPPPPPPPPVPSVPPLPTSMPPPLPAADDPRSALMEAIRSGPHLKPLSSTLNENKKLSDSRGELMDQIRQGVELKPVAHTNSSSSSSNNNPQHNGLAGALARALAERSKVFHSDTSDSSGDDDAEDEEEWDD